MVLPTQFQPIYVPDWVWQRPETRALLSGRDVAGLFRLAQQFGGVSQARIAAAVGISQSRVNEVINGRREVANLDVLLRIAAGLHMPDGARMAMGLAPLNGSATVTEASSEIAGVYPGQAEVAEVIRRRASSANRIDILAVRALGIVGLNDSLIRPALLTREGPVRVRVVLLDPDCGAAVQRAEEIGESHTSFAAGIRLSIARLTEIGTAGAGVDLALRLSSRLPAWRILSMDDVQYVSAFGAAWEGHESTVYEIPRTSRGAFWAGFERLFEDTWQEAAPVIGEVG